MAKRFTDTNKYKKPFIRSLPGSYKLLWDFLYHDCDHAGIWILDFQIAQAYIGDDMKIDRKTALELFNTEDETRIIELDNGKKWFLPSFIDFQYGHLSEKNRAHCNVISILKKFDLLEDDLTIKKNIKPLTRPLQGAKEKEKEQEKEQEKEMEMEKELETEKGGMGEKTKTVYQECVDAYFTFFKSKNDDVPPKFDKSHGDSLKSIISHLSKISKEKSPGLSPPEADKEVVKSFKFILSKWGKLTEFTQQFTDLRSMNSNFNRIITELKNGTHKKSKNGEPTGSAVDTGSAVSKIASAYAGNGSS